MRQMNALRQSPCYTQEMIQLGFQFVTVNSDIRLFVGLLRRSLRFWNRWDARAFASKTVLKQSGPY